LVEAQQEEVCVPPVGRGPQVENRCTRGRLVRHVQRERGQKTDIFPEPCRDCKS